MWENIEPSSKGFEESIINVDDNNQAGLQKTVSLRLRQETVSKGTFIAPQEPTTEAPRRNHTEEVGDETLLPPAVVETFEGEGNEVTKMVHIKTLTKLKSFSDIKKGTPLTTNDVMNGTGNPCWMHSTRTAPLSTATGKSSGRGRSGTVSVGGAERYGYLSFSEVQVDDDEDEESRLDLGAFRNYASSGALNLRDTGNGMYRKDVLQRRLRKRARAWKVFLAVMQEHGLRVRKYHRRGSGSAHRVVKYDGSLPGLRWKSTKWWNSGGGQIPLVDVLDVERRGKVVWVKCLHLGTVGFEASLETDAVIFYLAMDSLLDKRCGVDSPFDTRLSWPAPA